MQKIALLSAVVLSLSACVFAPESGPSRMERISSIDEVAKQAIKTCGAGNVLTVTDKTFTCR